MIKAHEEHEAALAHIETLMDAAPDSGEEGELELWAMLAEQDQQHHFPVGSSDRIEAIKIRLDQGPIENQIPVTKGEHGS